MVDNETGSIRKKMEVEILNQSRQGNHPQGAVDLSDGGFDAYVASDRLTLVDFWAPWCAPCRFVSPLVEQLGTQYAASMNTGKLNVDDNPIVSSRYGITSIPTLMFFRKGKPVDYVIGAVPKNVLEGKIKSLLGST
ncbi:MAG: thioredoxin [Candidatus Thermoplasmatota archaeon]|nr:thioredoxin [Candidatus Thermoplasmatota archaeon]